MSAQPSSLEENNCTGAEFKDLVSNVHGGNLRRATTTTLQINLGRRCNQSCSHCHLSAGPDRTETMNSSVIDRTLSVLAASGEVRNVDLTGGAPELHPEFFTVVNITKSLGRRVIDRCNLTVLLEPGNEHVAEQMAEAGVEIIASLPCYTADGVESQRGIASFEKSIRALRILNGLGYGMPNSPLELSLVYNPLRAVLPPSQEKLEDDYRRVLREAYGVEFNRLFTMTNMPIGRFGSALSKTNDFHRYSNLLRRNFNAGVIDALMCRSVVSVGWQGALFDCDFNQALGIGTSGEKTSVWDVNTFAELDNTFITTGVHCFACTAGAGSSCTGSLSDSERNCEWQQ